MFLRPPMMSVYVYAALVGLVLAIVGGAYVKGRVDSNARCEARVAALHAEYKAAAETEKARQREANARAVDIARKHVVEIEAERDALFDLLDQNAAEAAADPHAADCGLGADSVQRLKRLTTPGP